MEQPWHCPVCKKNFKRVRTFLQHHRNRKNHECQLFYRDNPAAQPSGPYHSNPEEREAAAAASLAQVEATLPNTNRVESPTPTSIGVNLSPNEASSPSFSLNGDAFTDFDPDSDNVTPNGGNAESNHDEPSPSGDQPTPDDANNNWPDFERLYAQYLGNLDPVEKVLGANNSYSKTKEYETGVREKFIRYQAKARQHNEKMQPKHKCALQLMAILDKEGVSLALYNQLMDWHIENSTCNNCNMNTQEKVKDKELFKHLRVRHGMEDLSPYLVRTYLPDAKTNIDIPCHDASAMLRDLLTDPRITDDDYLFFNNNPLAGPPPDWDELTDINTGLAYRETYNRIIAPDPKSKCGQRTKVLLPVMMYMDGCVTGQFQNLSLELLKMTCGIFTAEARDKGHLWRNLGAMPKVRQSKAKANSILGDSSNADAKSYLTHEELQSLIPNNQPEAGVVRLNGGGGGNISQNTTNNGSIRQNVALDGNVSQNVTQNGSDGSNVGDISLNGGFGVSVTQNTTNNTLNGRSKRSKQPKTTRWSPKFDSDEYIPEHCETLDEALSDPEMPSNNAQDFHCMLHTALASYKELQDKEGIEWDLFFQGKLWYLLLIPFIIFIKGDGVEQEKHCAKYGVRSGQVRCLCRHCCCPTEDTDNPYARYALKTKPMLVKLIREKDFHGLRVISQKYVWNAWYELRFGLHNNRSIHGASPMEILHWIQLGQYKYTRSMIFEQTGEGQMGQDLNDYCCALGPMFQRQSDKTFPRCNFTNTIMKGILMAHEMTGVILVLLVAMRSTKGRKIMVECARSTKQKNHFRFIDDWIMLLELQLQMISWLKSPKMKVSDVLCFRSKCREYMQLYKLVGNRIKGMKFKTMNFHGVLHVADDILNFGVPNNVDTKSDEHHHRDDKKATKRTQHRPESFDIQSLDRIVDRRAVQYGIAELNGAKRWEYTVGIKHHNQRKRSPDSPHVASPDGQNEASSGSFSQNQPSDETFSQNEPYDVANTQHGPLKEVMKQYNAIFAQNNASFGPNQANNSQTGPQDAPDDGFTLWGVKADFAWCKEKDDYVMSTKSRMKNKDKYKYEPSVKAAISTICFDCEEHLQPISTYSEIRFDNGQTYRASPSHLGKPWCDWARNGHKLFHIKCFVDLRGLPTINDTPYESKVYMITEPASVVLDEDDRYYPCDLVQAWTKGPDTEFPNIKHLNRIVTQPVANITGPACVIPDLDNPNHRAFLRVVPPSDWAKLFLDFLRSPDIRPDQGNPSQTESNKD